VVKLVEGGVLSGEGYESGCYVKPAIAEAENSFEIVQHETLLQVFIEIFGNSRKCT
jgi:aldehyde dehydrogenase (NAD+)